MIFRQPMIDAILAGCKTVIRRPVRFANPESGRCPYPCHYKPGRTYAVQPGRGQKEVARIRVLSVEREPLYLLTSRSGECHREGFPTVRACMTYWSDLYGSFDLRQMVDRIEFELVEAALTGRDNEADEGGENDGK